MNRPEPVVASLKGAPIWGALLGTLALGAWMRWGLAGGVPLGAEFENLRHAHSHLGYFGVLFPLAWAGWRRAGAPTPGPRVLLVYALATVMAVVGFLRAGYAPEATFGSGVVGGVWVLSLWPLRHRVLSWTDPLATVPGGVLVAMACVPPIALNLRSDPAQAAALVATFLAVLLLVVIAPSALAGRRLQAPGAPLAGLAGILGAASLGVWPTGWARMGLALYALWLVLAVVREKGEGDPLPLHLRITWLGTGAGLLVMALGLLPNTRPVVIGAIHFFVLSPVLVSLVEGRLRRPPSSWSWLSLHACVALLAAPLVVQGLGGGGWTLTLSAVGGTGVLLWWTAVLGFQLAPGEPATRR